MPNCRVCKQPMTEDAQFCGQCGASIDASAPPTHVLLPPSQNPNKILILIIAILTVALVAVSSLKTGAIPIPWTQRPQNPSPASTAQPVLRSSPPIPYRLRCHCDIALTITKMSIDPAAGVQVWNLLFQDTSGTSAVLDSLPSFYLQDSSNTYQAFGEITPGYSCPLALDPGQTMSKAVVFFLVTLAHTQYTLTSKLYPCGGNSYLDFDPVTFTFS